jgi:hypothetical protein
MVDARKPIFPDVDQGAMEHLCVEEYPFAV